MQRGEQPTEPAAGAASQRPSAAPMPRRFNPIAAGVFCLCIILPILCMARGLDLLAAVALYAIVSVLHLALSVAWGLAADVGIEEIALGLGNAVLRLLRLMTTAANMLPPRMWVAILVMLARGAHAKKPRRRSR